jgi:hypothetical protein
MEVADRPYIAVIGGLRQLSGKAVEDARAAGRAVGQELARAGFGLVVYFSNEDSLEPHVVSGYAAAIAEGIGLIRVRYAESQRGLVTFTEQAGRPELFAHHLFPGQDWEAPFYRSLAEEDGVDGVLVLGGARSTFIAGQIALARCLPVLAIDGFGGAATRIWNQLAQASPGHSVRTWAGQSPQVLVSELKAQCLEAAMRRRQARDRERIAQRLLDHRVRAAWTGASFLALLFACFLGLVYTPYASAYPVIVLAGLIAAGATGALARSLLVEGVASDAWTSLLLGGLAGFVVGLAYLIPQWVGAPGPLAPRVETITATDKIQFASAVLIAVSAGVGFDTVFNRLQKEADKVPVGLQS